MKTYSNLTDAERKEFIDLFFAHPDITEVLTPEEQEKNPYSWHDPWNWFSNPDASATVSGLVNIYVNKLKATDCI